MGKRSSGFTLIELMIVVSIIAIIAAIAIPNLLRSRMSANEASAVSGVRSISTGEVGYQAAAFSDDNNDGLGDYGTLVQLGDPDGGGATPPFIDAILSSGNKLGYIYTATVIPGSTTVAPSFNCMAVPSALGRSGWRQFFVDETGIIRATTDGSAVSASSPPLD